MLTILYLSSILFAISGVFLLVAMLIKSVSIEKVGKVLFLISFLIEIAYFIIRWVKSYQLGIGHIPITNAFDSFVFFTMVVAFGQLLFIKRAKPLVVAFVALIIFGIIEFLSLSYLNSNIEPLIPALKSNWLMWHVTTSFMAYAAFFFNFLFADIILFGSNKSIHKIIGLTVVDAIAVFILGSLAFKAFHVSYMDILFFSIIFVFLWFVMFLAFKKFEFDTTTNDNLKKWMDISAYVGFVFLTVGIITGAIWAKYVWGGYWSWDPKETWSLITWIVYLIYLHLNARKKSIATLAYSGLLGFLCVLITYIGVNFFLYGLHSYGAA